MRRLISDKQKEEENLLSKISKKVLQIIHCFQFNRILSYKFVFPLSTQFSLNVGENPKALFFKR
jgi:hypothetical protein